MRWGRNRRSGRASLRRNDVAASEVVGTILLVGITVVMAAGFALLLSGFSRPINLAHADLDIQINAGEDDIWGTLDDKIIIRHMGGEALDPNATTILLQVGSVRETLRGEAIDDVGEALEDGRFSIGESLVLLRTIGLGTTVDIIVTYSQGGSSIVATNTINPGGVVVPGGELFAYPTSGTQVEGSVANLPALQAAQGDLATYTEALIPTTTIGVRTAAAATGSGATDPNNARISENLYSVLPGSGTSVRVSSWGASGTTEIQSVTAFLESRYVSTGPGGGTNDVIRFRQQHGTTSVKSADFAPTAADSVRSMPLNVPSGSVWTWSHIGNLALQAEYVQVGGADKRNFQVDSMWIELTVSGTVYVLDARLNFADVPSGNQWQVQARYSTELDTFRIEVRNPGAGTWSVCGTLTASATLTDWSGCMLSIGQYNNGNPTLRIIDLTPSTTQEGKLHLDYVRIRIS